MASCDLAVASRDRQVRHARRQYRPVLLDPDGRALAQRFAQARDGDAADRRTDRGASMPRASASSIAWSSPAERDEAVELAETIAAKSRMTVKIGKEAFYRQLEMPLPRPTTTPRRSWSRTCWRATPRKASAPSSTSGRPSGKTADFHTDVCNSCVSTMNHDSYSDTYIRGILNTVKTIAMVGASVNEFGRATLLSNICLSGAFT